MRASVAQSTQPTPRHGVGLNELLGRALWQCNHQPDHSGDKSCEVEQHSVREATQTWITELPMLSEEEKFEESETAGNVVA